MGAQAPTPKYVYLADNASQLWDGDLLLFRGRGIVSRAISWLTGSPYTHAAMVVWVNGVPFCAEVREWHNGRLTTLASQVRKYSGQIDVYKADPKNLYNGKHRHTAARNMERMSGVDYDYWSVIKAGFARLPLLRLLVLRFPKLKVLGLWKRMRQNEHERASALDSPAYCSMAIDIAWLGAGIDVVRNIDSEFTEPQHLAQSMFFEYLFTLK